MNYKPTSTTFHGLGIAPLLLEALERLRFTLPTPIQQQAIPIAAQGKDIVGIAQTGTGKTLAYGIPMIQRLAQVKGNALVIVPTRELALQVEETLEQIGRTFGLRIAVLIGGTPYGPQRRNLSQKPHVIIATPGRLIDHLEQKTFRLNDSRIIILDEADRMLDMGFAPQIQRIITALPKERQTMLFSATMPPKIFKMAASYMKLPVRIEIAPTGTTAERVTQEIFIVAKDIKIRLLDKILSDYAGTTLVFMKTKHGTKKLARAVRAMGHTVAELHGNRSLSQRRDALQGFKSGKYRVLIATDIASRGIDVIGIDLVINYDLPMSSEDYVHRIGRTARAGAGGHAISFVTPDQRYDLRSIERLIRKNLPISQLPELPPERPRPEFSPTRFRSQQPRGFGRSYPRMGVRRRGDS